MAGKHGTPVLPEKYASGEYAVGTACFTVIDKNRKEVCEDGTADRKIAVRMYYPAEKSAAAGKKRAPIFSAAKKAAIMKALRLKTISEKLCYADYYENIPIAPARKFPLILFSMGYNCYMESNTYLLCALASRGYIVASVGHAQEAIENDYEDGSTDYFDKRILKKMYTNMLGALWFQMRMFKKKLEPHEALKQTEVFQNRYIPFLKGRVSEWEQDVLKATEAVKARYAAHLDLSRGIGATGHSMGGCTAYHLCRYHDAFACGINIDGGLFGSYPERTMTKPFCQISCKDNLNVETRPFFNTKAATYHVVFSDLKHNGFTDMKYLVPSAFMTGKMHPAEMLRHLIYCHVTFFDKYLKGADIPFDGLPSAHITYAKIV